MNKIYSIKEDEPDIYNEETERKCFKCLKEKDGLCIDCLHHEKFYDKEHKNNIRLSVIETIGLGNRSFSVVNNRTGKKEYYWINYDKYFFPEEVIQMEEEVKVNCLMKKYFEARIKRSYRSCVKKLEKDKVNEVCLKKLLILSAYTYLDDFRKKDLTISNTISIDSKYKGYIYFDNMNLIVEVFSN